MTSTIAEPLLAPSKTLLPGAVARDDVFSAPVVARGLTSAAVVSDDVVRVAGASSSVLLSLLLIVDIDLCPSPMSAESVHPSLHLDEDLLLGAEYAQSVELQNPTYAEFSSFPSPVLSLFLSPEFLEGDDFLGDGLLVPGEACLGAGEVEGADTLPGPALDASYGLPGAWLDDQDSLQVPLLLLMLRFLEPDVHIDPDEVDLFFLNGLAPQGDLLPFDAFLDEELFPDAQAQAGEVSLSPSLGDDQDAIPPPQGEAGAQLDQAVLLLDQDEIVPAAAEPGEVWIESAPAIDDDSVGSAGLVPGEVAGQPDDSHSSDDDHFDHTVIAGDASIGGFPHQELDVISVMMIQPSPSPMGSTIHVDLDHFTKVKITGGKPWPKAPPLRGSVGDKSYMYGSVSRSPPPLGGSIGRVS